MAFLRRRSLHVAGILSIFVPTLVVVLFWQRAEGGLGPKSPERYGAAASSLHGNPADSSRRQGPREDPTLPKRKEVLGAAGRAEGLEALRRMKLQGRFEREAELLLEKEGRLGCGFMPPGRFVRMAGFHQPEIDLFSRGYPELAQEWAKVATESKETPEWERSAAVTCLGALWRAGWASAALALAPICRSPSPWEADYALWRISDGDVSGRYRSLYRELAKAGQSGALEALSYWDDSEVVAILTEVQTQWRNLPAPPGHQSPDRPRSPSAPEGIRLRNLGGTREEGDPRRTGACPSRQHRMGASNRRGKAAAMAGGGPAAADGAGVLERRGPFHALRASNYPGRRLR